MMDKFVYEYAIEAIFNNDLAEVTERWDCPECGNSYIKISCSKPHLRQDLLLQNEHRGKGWKIFSIVYPEFDIEASCECGSSKSHLKLVRGDNENEDL